MKTIQDHLNLIRTLENTTVLQEGEIGRKIGSTIGGIFGKDAGDRLGQIGSNIGDIFDPVTKSVVKADPADIKSVPANTAGASKSRPANSGSSAEPTDDKSWQIKAGPNAATDADQKFFMKNPDGSTSEVNPPEGGFKGKGNNPTNSAGKETDKYGNSADDYTKQDMFAISTGYGGKKSTGKLEAEIQGIEDARGTGLKVVDAWSWKNSVLVLLDGDRTKAQGGIGIWTEFGTNASAGGNEFAPLYKKLGYTEFQGDADVRTIGPFGKAFGSLHKMKRPDGKAVVVCELYQYYTFQSRKGKGLHMYTVTFLGPEEDWATGGREELRQLHNSLKLSGEVQPLSPMSATEQIQHLRNRLFQN